MRLEGKIALITGAAHGLGAEEARMFAREGARVVVTDIDDNEGSKVADQILDSDGAAIFVHLDVTKEADWKNAVESTITAFGALNILVNNAGISGTGVKDFGDTRMWDSLMQVNITGSYFGIKYVVREMRKSGGGSIVNIASTSGFAASPGNHPGYTASKGASRLLAKSAAVWFAEDNIRVNSVHPGALPMMRSSLSTVAAKEACEKVKGKIHLGRAGRREEAAYGVLFLASDEASYITGTELVIDGGLLAAL